MIPLDRPLTQRQGVVLGGRVLCVFFVFWSLVNLSYLPGDVSGLWHYLHHGDGVAAESYNSFMKAHYVGYISGAVLRATVELWVAGVFYRCGPKIAGFLLPSSGDAEAVPEEGGM